MITRTSPILAVLLAMICLAEAADPATLVFYRLGDQGAMIRASIKIDSDQPTHKLHLARVWTTSVAPGDHFIYGDQKDLGRSYSLISGKTYFFRVEYMHATVMHKARFRCVLVPEEIAREESLGLKQEK